jgi:hypothetical protein
MNDRESGTTNPLLISTVLLGLLAVIFGGVMLWALTNYADQKNNVDAKVGVAVLAAKKTQAAADNKTYIEKAKQPYAQFSGPDDFGSVTFNYPKTWSVYIGQDGVNNNTYQAYLNPTPVPPVSQSQAYATRVFITSTEYSSSLQTYQAAIKAGKLKSKPIVVNGFTGVYLSGEFNSTHKGSAVIFKVRDKTLTIATDSTSFQHDFDSIIVKSLDFNP